MLKRLQEKWNISPVQLILVLCTFAIGGSLSGIAAKWIMSYLPINNRAIWLPIYIMVVTFLWPFCVLLISIFFGQFSFFKTYLSAMGKRITGKRTKKHVMTNIAIFASGAGSNAAKIIEHFRQHASIRVALVVCNKKTAGVIKIAEDAGIPVLLIEKERFFNSDAYLPEFSKNDIDLLILAGFLWKIPQKLVSAFPMGIINIHPALLPKYGGKGMYGKYVHEAVIAAKEEESGITIHFVDEHYDHGATIFQAFCSVTAEDNADTLAAKIHQLEHQHFPKVIEQVIIDRE